MNKVDITVIQKPIKVRFVCPKCEEEVYMKLSRKPTTLVVGMKAY